ncbi:Fur family transcriptional regulator [Chloroflexota bacterium]
MKLTEKKVASLLKQRGYRLTPQRRAVLSEIACSREHLTPAVIHEKVRREHPGIGLVTVYRTLDMLTGLGLLCEVHVGGGCRSYLLRRPLEHHHHLICSGCGAVMDFDGCALDGLAERLSHETGFKIEGHLLEFFGSCRECRGIKEEHLG